MIQTQLCSTFLVFIFIFWAKANSVLGPPGKHIFTTYFLIRNLRNATKIFPGTADLIDILNLQAQSTSLVEVSDGFCPNREGSGGRTSDVAYTIKDRSVASIPTAQLFPDGFPSDFSILTTFKANPQSRGMIFTFYNLEGKEILSLKIGRRFKLYYQGIKSSRRQVIKFGGRLADGEWHRLGLSVKGNSITAIIDCQKQQNREIDRPPGDTIASDGVVLMAQEIEDNTFFQGQIQQLLFVPSPEAAYELCKQYLPDCSDPIPRPLQDDGMVGYRGMDEDELFNREGLSPQEYLEFTERESLPANRSEVSKFYDFIFSILSFNF